MQSEKDVFQKNTSCRVSDVTVFRKNKVVSVKFSLEGTVGVGEGVEAAQRTSLDNSTVSAWVLANPATSRLLD